MSSIDTVFRIRFNQQLYDGMESTPASASTFIAFGSVIQSSLITCILLKTYRYYELFHRSDRAIIQFGVGILTILASAAFSMHCWQVTRIIHNAHDNMVSVFRADALCMWAYVLLGGVYSLITMTFYAFRIWRMVKRSWWVIPPLACCILAAFGMMLPYFTENVTLVRWYGGVTLVADGLMSASLISSLLGTQNSILQRQSERGILYKIIAVILESMVPPVLALVLILVGSFGNSAYLGWMRLPICALPMLYYHSLLFSLISRLTVRDLLDARPIGAYRMGDSSGGSGGGGGGGGDVLGSGRGLGSSGGTGAAGGITLKSDGTTTATTTLHGGSNDHGGFPHDTLHTLDSKYMHTHTHTHSEPPSLPALRRASTWAPSFALAAQAHDANVDLEANLAASTPVPALTDLTTERERPAEVAPMRRSHSYRSGVSHRFGDEYVRGGGGWHPFSARALQVQMQMQNRPDDIALSPVRSSWHQRNSGLLEQPGQSVEHLVLDDDGVGMAR